MAKKVLIIDDETDIRGLLNIRLRKAGYETAFAADAVTAMSVARKEQPDLIVLDLGLPGGDGYVSWSGFGRCRRDPRSNEERALAAGARAFLAKPIDVERLLAAAHDALAD